MPAFSKIARTMQATVLFVNGINAYSLVTEHKGATFFDNFTFFTDADPTHGAVRYVAEAEAVSSRLVGLVETSSSDPSIYIGVDSTNQANNNRPSVRITGTDSYNHGLLIANIAAMPSQCGVWPALWLTGPDWPNSGEIDIIEGVNWGGQKAAQNQATLHTGANCAIPDTNTGFAGTVATPDCDVNNPTQSKNAGCGILAPVNETYTIDNRSCTHATAGPEFNAQGGGVYATLWTSTGVSIYFFPREYVPTDITSGRPDPSTWSSQPQAVFGGSSCSFDSSLKNLQLVVNTAFCGDWANSTWTSDGCAASTGIATCEEYVNSHPEAFADAYWLINSISMYQNDTGASAMTKRDASADPSSIGSVERKNIKIGHRAETDFTQRAIRLPGPKLGNLVSAAAGIKPVLATVIVAAVFAIFA